MYKGKKGGKATACSTGTKMGGKAPNAGTKFMSDKDFSEAMKGKNLSGSGK